MGGPSQTTNTGGDCSDVCTSAAVLPERKPSQELSALSAPKVSAEKRDKILHDQVQEFVEKMAPGASCECGMVEQVLPFIEDDRKSALVLGDALQKRANEIVAGYQKGDISREEAEKALEAIEKDVMALREALEQVVQPLQEEIWRGSSSANDDHLEKLQAQIEQLDQEHANLTAMRLGQVADLQEKVKTFDQFVGAQDFEPNTELSGEEQIFRREAIFLVQALQEQADQAVEQMRMGQISTEEANQRLEEISCNIETVLNALGTKKQVIESRLYYPPEVERVTGRHLREVEDQIEEIGKMQLAWAHTQLEKMEELRRVASTETQADVLQRELERTMARNEQGVSSVQDDLLQAAISWNKLQGFLKRESIVSFRPDGTQTVASSSKVDDIQRAAADLSLWMERVGKAFNLNNSMDSSYETSQVSGAQLEEFLREYEAKMKTLTDAVQRAKESGQIPLPEHVSEDQREQFLEDLKTYVGPLSERMERVHQGLMLLSTKCAATGSDLAVEQRSVVGLDYARYLDESWVSSATAVSHGISRMSQAIKSLSAILGKGTTSGDGASGDQTTGQESAFDDLVEVCDQLRREWGNIVSGLSENPSESYGRFVESFTDTIDKLRAKGLIAFKESGVFGEEFSMEEFSKLSPDERLESLRNELGRAVKEGRIQRDQADEVFKIIRDTFQFGEGIRKEEQEWFQSERERILQDIAVAQRENRTQDIGILKQALADLQAQHRKFEEKFRRFEHACNRIQDAVRNGDAQEIDAATDEVVDSFNDIKEEADHVGEENPEVARVEEGLLPFMTPEERGRLEQYKARSRAAAQRFHDNLRQLEHTVTELVRESREYSRMLTAGHIRWDSSLTRQWVPVLGLYLFGKSSVTLSEFFYQFRVEEMLEQMRWKGLDPPLEPDVLFSGSESEEERNSLVEGIQLRFLEEVFAKPREDEQRAQEVAARLREVRGDDFDGLLPPNGVDADLTALMSPMLRRKTRKEQEKDEEDRKKAIV